MALIASTEPAPERRRRSSPPRRPLGVRFSRALCAAAGTGLLAALACNTLPLLLMPPGAADAIPGGLADTRPFFGRVTNVTLLENGEFMLATCGCGDWRTLFDFRDGTAPIQLPVRFYAPGGVEPAGNVTVYGREEDRVLAGTIFRARERTGGTAWLGARLLNFEGVRRETHADDAAACVRCHIGEDPIWPQPPQHPPFRLDPPDCLSCHQVVITR